MKSEEIVKQLLEAKEKYDIYSLDELYLYTDIRLQDVEKICTDFLTLVRVLEDASKRSNYPWSEGGSYNSYDEGNERVIEFAVRTLAKLNGEPSAKENE